jgi:putative oxidoreductase
MKASAIAILILRVALGGFFIYSGAQKLMDLSDFVDTIGNYQIVDRPWDAVFGYFVPWLEIVTGFAIVTGFCFRSGLAILMAMLLGFSIAIAWVWSQGLNINCGCYGTSDEPTNYPMHIAINVGLILITAGLFWTSLRRSAKTPA